MRYRGDISGEEYAAMEDGYEQGRAEASRRHRAEPEMILPEDDLRVQAAVRACSGWEQSIRLGYSIDWRDVAEVVNVVLAVDDAMAGQ